MLSKFCRFSRLLALPVRRTVFPCARFSTSLEKVDKVRSKLQKALQKELKYEEENYQKDDTVEVFIDFRE